jgi:hypothetical protein
LSEVFDYEDENDDEDGRKGELDAPLRSLSRAAILLARRGLL